MRKISTNWARKRGTVKRWIFIDPRPIDAGVTSARPADVFYFFRPLTVPHTETRLIK